MRASNDLLLTTLETLLCEKKYGVLRELLIIQNPADIAALFEEAPAHSLPLLFRLLPKALAAETFVEMEPDLQELLIRGFSDTELKAVLDELYLDDAAALVDEMPAILVKRILRNADPHTRKMINQILQYPEDSAGSIMTIEYVRLRPHMTVEESILHIRRTGVDKETIYTCYVTDNNRKLIGIISAKTLLLSDDDALVEDLMETNPIFVHTTEDKERVAQLFDKYDFLSLPVVDEEQRLVGIVTVDDAIDVLQEAYTEDIERMAAIVPSDRPYLKTSAFELYKARIPWLMILMVSATFTGMIITSFESALAAQVVLTAFIPMLMDTGGNCGSQSSTTVIRGLSLGELAFSDLPRVLGKEFRVSLLCGLTLSAVNFLKLLFFDRVGITIAAVVSLTLICTVFCAKLVGCALPILSERAGFDPAVMSSPFITTIVDAISLTIYFSIATFLLHL
ncbi:MAG: magnesium transporter [Clostridiales bacterium]|nr:magnesium transporter [Clostridiales bacterium]